MSRRVSPRGGASPSLDRATRTRFDCFDEATLVLRAPMPGRNVRGLVTTAGTIGIAVVIGLGGGGCKKDKPAPSGASSAAGPPAQGTDGGGDGSGSSIANARALSKTSPATFTIPCAGAMYIGPFRFTRDPETLALHSVAKSPSGAQICAGGSWVDSSGTFSGTVGLGCPEAEKVAETDVTFEYSPGNGGNGTNPVYLMVKFDEAKPAGCKSAEVTLSLR